MTRWKREPRATLLLMYAHNQWSRWNGHVLAAADRLGLLVGFEMDPNHSGYGSTDREWYVMASELERVGGKLAVHDVAHELAEVERSELEASEARFIRDSEVAHDDGS